MSEATALDYRKSEDFKHVTNVFQGNEQVARIIHYHNGWSVSSNPVDGVFTKKKRLKDLEECKQYLEEMINESL